MRLTYKKRETNETCIFDHSPVARRMTCVIYSAKGKITFSLSKLELLAAIDKFSDSYTDFLRGKNCMITILDSPKVPIKIDVCSKLGYDTGYLSISNGVVEDNCDILLTQVDKLYEYLRQLRRAIIASM